MFQQHKIFDFLASIIAFACQQTLLFIKKSHYQRYAMNYVMFKIKDLSHWFLVRRNNTNYKHSLIMLLWWTLSVYICTHSILIQFYLLTQFHSHNKYFKFDAILTILRFTKIRNVQNNINTGVNKLYNTQVTTIFLRTLHSQCQTKYRWSMLKTI